MIGGVVATLDGKTSIDGLLAAGEATSTGLHGANRLASNSLLEGVVCGRRAGKLAVEPDQDQPHVNFHYDRQSEATGALNLKDIANAVKGGMWRYMGVERESDGA